MMVMMIGDDRPIHWLEIVADLSAFASIQAENSALVRSELDSDVAGEGANNVKSLLRLASVARVRLHVVRVKQTSDPR